MFGVRKACPKPLGRGYHPAVFRRGVGVVLALSIAATGSAMAAGHPNLAAALKAFKRPHKSYDNLPPLTNKIDGVVSSRRVATAEDLKKNRFYVYVTQMKNKTACVVLVQGRTASSQCRPETLMFDTGRETSTVVSGLIGGVAQNTVKKIVFTGGSKKLTIPLTTDNGYLYGCPPPGTCARWVRTVVGYDAHGKIVSQEPVQ
jgi:hypothetical protein